MKTPAHITKEKHLKKSSQQPAALTLEEKCAFLQDIIMTPIGEINENSRLCQSYKRTTDSVEYQMPCKLRALTLLVDLLDRQKHTKKLATAVELQERIQAVSPLLQRRAQRKKPSEA